MAVSGSEDTLRTWWRRLSGINGFVAVAFGIILLVWPKGTLAVVAVLLGIWLIFSAVMQLIQALRPSRAESETSRTVEVISAVVYLITGAFCLRHPFHTVTFLAALVGVALLVFGAMSIFGSGQRQAGWRRVPQLAVGVVTVIGGIVLLIWPSMTLVRITNIAGILLLVLGIVQVVATYRGPRTGAAGHGTPRRA